MTWRCANRRKGRRLELATVEPYLGDVIGEPLSPMRPVYRVRTYGWIERGLPVLMAWIACAVLAALVAAHLALLFWFYPATPFSVN